MKNIKLHRNHRFLDFLHANSSITTTQFGIPVSEISIEAGILSKLIFKYRKIGYYKTYTENESTHIQITLIKNIHVKYFPKLGMSLKPTKIDLDFAPK